MPDTATTWRTPWRAVAATFFLSGFLFGAWAGRVPAFVDRFALAEHGLGLLLLCIAFGAVASFPFAGHFADRTGAARLSLLLGSATTLSFLVLPLCPTIPLLAAALFLFGATQGSLDVAMNAWAAEVERHMGRPVMSAFHAMFSLGGGIGAGSAYLAAGAGLGAGLHFLLAGFAIAAPWLALAAIRWPSARTAPGGPRFALPRGTLVLVGLIAFCSALGEGAMADWSAVYLHAVKGMNEAQAALGYATFSATMVAARLTADRFVQRYGAVTSARLGGVFAALGMAVTLVAGNLAATLAGFAAMGLGYAVIFPLAYSRAANDPDISPGRAIASVAILGYGGMLMGPPAIGFIAALTSLDHAFALIGVLSLLIVGLAGCLRPAITAGGATARAAAPASTSAKTVRTEPV